MTKCTINTLRRCALFAALSTLSLSGCALSGITGSSSSFKCKAPAGVTCTSMTGIYANADTILNRQPQDAIPNAAPATRGGGPIPVAGQPIFAAPEVVRIWFAPWRDDQNDLHDESMIYTVKSPGHWLLDARDGLAPASFVAPEIEAIVPTSVAR